VNRRGIVWVVGAVLALGWAKSAEAESAKAACNAPVTYRGQALRPPPELPAIAGDVRGEFGSEVAARLRQAVIKAQQATGAASMTVAVAVPGAALWTTEMSGANPREAQSTGLSGGTGQAPLHYWASAGKTFVAIVMLQLVEEGKIALTDKVSRWIDGVPHGDAMTIEHLLAHTSGLFSANEDLRVRKAFRYHSPAENLAVSKKHGPQFCPGEAWRYTNTGYDLLGMIIERVDRRSFPDAIHARIIAPLGLTRLRVLRPAQPASDAAPVPPVAPLVSTKERPIDPRWPGAAGAIAGSADDMLRVWHALLTHRLLKAESVEKMFARLYPMFTPVEFYGLGVMCFDLPEADGSKTTWIGHAGGTPGAGAIVAYSLADGAFVAVALTGDGSAPATASLLLRELRASRKQGAQ
jgi:D-alanyl-D-alanine carboxypeptidase